MKDGKGRMQEEARDEETKRKEQQGAENRRINEKKTYQDKEKALEMVEQKAKKDATGPNGVVPEEAPETREVKTARDELRNQHRRLNKAQEHENQVKDYIVEEPIGSASNRSTKKQQTVRVRDLVNAYYPTRINLQHLHPKDQTRKLRLQGNHHQEV